MPPVTFGMASDAPISVTRGRCRVCLNNRHLGAIAQDVDHIDNQFGLVGRDLCCCFLLPIPHSSTLPTALIPILRNDFCAIRAVLRGDLAARPLSCGPRGARSCATFCEERTIRRRECFWEYVATKCRPIRIRNDRDQSGVPAQPPHREIGLLKTQF